MNTKKKFGLLTVIAGLGLLSTMCSDNGSDGNTGGAASTTGGASATGGNASGGNATGGNTTGGAAITGGSANTGGNATGGAAATGGASNTGGSSTGGASATGGSGGGSAGGSPGGAGGSSAGNSSGGAETGGSGGGSSSGGSASGGTAGGSKATGGAGGSGGGVTFAQVAKLFGDKCSSCHDGRTGRVNLKNDDSLYMRLTSVLSGLNKCNGFKLVDTSDSAHSILPQILQGDVNLTSGSNTCMQTRMPPTGALGQADLKTITDWISAGAPGP